MDKKSTADDMPISSKQADTFSIDDTVMMDFSDFRERKEFLKPKRERAESRPINEYTLEGEYLTTYKTGQEASKKVGISSSSVYSCCHGTVLFSPKYKRIWLYVGDDIEERLRKIEALKMTKDKPLVDEYTLKGRWLFSYPKYGMAAKANSISTYGVKLCCEGKKLFINNRIFLPHGGDIKERLALIKEYQRLESSKRKKRRPVDEYTLDGKYVRSFPSITLAAKEYNVPITTIWRCCTGKHLKVKGIGIFLYTGDSILRRFELIEELKKIKDC